MEFVSFKSNEQESYRLGVRIDNGILDVVATFQDIPGNNIPKTMKELIKAGRNEIRTLKNYLDKLETQDINNALISEDNVIFGPCISNPEKIICVGLNYRKHAEESKMEIPKFPILFNKYNNSLAGHKEDIFLPTNCSEIDYEAELAIIIGEKAKKVSKEDALNYVFGYSIANDLSARDLQFRTNQWLLGKSLDGFCPLGPTLVTADQIDNPNNLEIRCRVNGKTRQDSNTSDMIFYCDEIISYISQYITLEPGDIILTGTPEGVIMGYPLNEREWLKDGDEVTIEISQLGKLTNSLSRGSISDN